MHPYFMRLEDVMSATGLSRAAIYAMMALGQFPRQIRIGERSVAWISTEVQAWINAKIAANRAA